MNVLKIDRLIPQAQTKQLILVPYLIAEIDSKDTHQMISVLKEDDQYQNKKQRDNDINPYAKVKERAFLKRVKKGENGKVQILVCLQDSEEKEVILGKLKEKGKIQRVYIKELPKEAPLTKVQFQQWSKMWPINFIQQEIIREVIHSPKQKELLLNLCLNIEQFPEQIYLYNPKTFQILLKTKGECLQNTIKHPIMKLLQDWPLSEPFLKSPQEYYFLTNLKMFTRINICGMCSMALVHSRLHSIYSACAFSQTMDMVMGCPKLNHQIAMFNLNTKVNEKDQKQKQNKKDLKQQ